MNVRSTVRPGLSGPTIIAPERRAEPVLTFRQIREFERRRCPTRFDEECLCIRRREIAGEKWIVIDGSPVSSGSFGSTLASISVHDIARIDVLKDAAAAAIYGIRGANGVVVVTTRRGR